MRCLAVCYAVILLVGVVCAQVTREDSQTDVDREKRVAIPYPIYLGASALLRRLLMGAGRTALRNKQQHSKPCHNNRGWCRARCFSHERVLPGWGSFCGGGYQCCVN